MFEGTNLALSSDVDQDTHGKVKKTQQKHTRSQKVTLFPAGDHKAARNRQGSMTKTNT